MSLGTNIKSYFQSNNNSESENKITNILKRHTVGQKYNLSDYLQKYDAINKLSEYLKKYNQYNNKNTQYTLIGVGKSYYDFLVINQNLETSVIRISDTETSYYYLEKIIQNTVSSLISVEEIKPDGLIVRLKDCLEIKNFNNYKDNIDNFRQKISSITNNVTNLRKRKIYKFEEESLYSSFLRNILVILRVKNSDLNSFLINKLKILNSIENVVKKDLYELSIEEIFSVTEYAKYFTENGLKILCEWFEKNLYELEAHYKSIGNTFIKRNIDYNNVLITSDGVEFVDYSKTRLGCYLVDLADYLSIAKSSAFDLSSICLYSEASDEYQFDFESINNENIEQTNFVNNNEKNKNKQNKDSDEQQQQNTLKTQLNTLVVLATLKNTAINIYNTGSQNQSEFKNKFTHIKTLSQFRDMLNTKYYNNPDTLFALNNISMKEYICIIIKQCVLCINDSESF